MYLECTFTFLGVRFQAGMRHLHNKMHRMVAERIVMRVMRGMFHMHTGSSCKLFPAASALKAHAGGFEAHEPDLCHEHALCQTWQGAFHHRQSCEGG